MRSFFILGMVILCSAAALAAPTGGPAIACVFLAAMGACFATYSIVADGMKKEKP